MTMTNAEWCIKNGIKFKNLCCKSCGDSRHECIGYYDANGNFNKCYVGKRLKSLGDLTSESILTWLDAEHVEPILDDAEKRYLAGVIRPFRNDVYAITKKTVCSDGAREYIVISANGVAIIFPSFDKNTMYKGMELGKRYTLEELGL